DRECTELHVVPPKSGRDRRAGRGEAIVVAERSPQDTGRYQRHHQSDWQRLDERNRDVDERILVQLGETLQFDAAFGQRGLARAGGPFLLELVLLVPGGEVGGYR